MRQRTTIACLLLAVLLSGCAERNPFDESNYVSPKPTHGGTLNVGTVSVTLSALSWDPADWTWKSNHDTGMVREQLFAADLDRSVRKGGPFPFIAEAYLPSDAIRGELARRWEWRDPLTLEVHLREGVYFPDKPGVMSRREINADDVIYTYDLLRTSPKKIPSYFDHIDSVEADGSAYGGVSLQRLQRRMGLPVRLRLLLGHRAARDERRRPEKLAHGHRHRTLRTHQYIHGNSQTHTRNPDYWDSETIDGEHYPIPFVDKVVYRIIKDEATYPHRPAHRQARYPRSDPLDRRGPSEGNHTRTALVPLARHRRHFPGAAHGPRASQ